MTTTTITIKEKKSAWPSRVSTKAKLETAVSESYRKSGIKEDPETGQIAMMISILGFMTTVYRISLYTPAPRPFNPHRMVLEEDIQIEDDEERALDLFEGLSKIFDPPIIQQNPLIQS